MKKQQNSDNLSTPLIDFIPAQLKENKEWSIVYYIKDPISNKLIRRRKRVPPHNRVTERRKMAVRMVSTINKKLDYGWNPIQEDEAPKSFTTIIDAQAMFITYTQRDVTTGEKRIDTLRTYKSILSNLVNWLKDNNKEKEYVMNFNTELVGNFLDNMYLVKKVSATTYNNNLGILKIFGKHLITKGYIKNNPLEMFDKKKKSPKKRSVIELDKLDEVFTALDNVSPEFKLLCKLIYYCYIRPTELSKLKVKDIILKDKLIYLSKDVSKKSSGHVTIPNSIIPDIAMHISKAKNDDYLFSRDLCKVGDVQSNGNIYYKLWQRWIVKPGITKEPLYSIKDSGITHALDNGVSPVSVKNQARHSDLTITTAYLRKNQNKSDASIEVANW